MTPLKPHLMALAAALVSVPLAAVAEDTDTPPARAPAPFQLSLWESVQIVDSTRPIHGVRLALPYGRNSDVYGLDVGIINRIDHDLEGVQFSITGIVDGDMKGLQYNWFFSSVGGEAQGAQMSVVNLAGTLEGAQLGAVNVAQSGGAGAALGFVNVSRGPTVGAELGIVNYASRIEGVQFGLVNVTEHLHGVQIGLVNVASNGFLPVFVIFNAAL
jgi:hypothetical protein